jgi:Rab GDP dissociation inhibitor
MKKYELEPNTIDFIGHAVALYSNDNFLEKPAI